MRDKSPKLKVANDKDIQTHVCNVFARFHVVLKKFVFDYSDTATKPRAYS